MSAAIVEERLQAVADRVAETADLVTVALDELLPRGEGPEQRLTEAMRYAALGPGKRLRPYFALETGRMFDAEERSVLRAACALECYFKRLRIDFEQQGAFLDRRAFLIVPPQQYTADTCAHFDFL